MTTPDQLLAYLVALDRDGLSDLPVIHDEFGPDAADLYRRLPREDRPRLVDALEGDPEAAGYLANMSSNDDRIALIRVLDDIGASPEVMRPVLTDLWVHDHRLVRAALPGRRLYQAWRRVRDPVQAFASIYGDTVTVWRGTYGVPLSTARRGWSWTTDKRVAAWFALRYGHDRMRYAGRRPPLVLRAVVPSRRVLFEGTDRAEYELLISGVRDAAVEGDRSTWQTWADAWERERDD